MTTKVIGLPPRTRLYRLEREESCCWKLWTAMSPCGNYGTYLLLFEDGAIFSVTLREDYPQEEFVVRKGDGFI